MARTVGRPVQRSLLAIRFRLWAARLGFELRRKGGRLVLDATGTPKFSHLPAIKAVRQGSGAGTLTLRIGADVRFGPGVVIEIWAPGTNILEIGDHSVFEGCILQLRSGAIRTADHVQIRNFSVVKSYGELEFGSQVIVNYSNAIHCEQSVVLEDLVGLAERVTIVDSDKLLTGSDDYFNDRPSRVGPIRIGRNTYLGAGAVITRGAAIGPNCAVAANAVVTAGEQPAGWLLAGVPARPIKALGDGAPPAD